MEVPYFMTTRYLIGWKHYIIKIFLLQRLLKQYDRVQGMPQGLAMYAWRQLDATEWGSTLSYNVACDEYQHLQLVIWNYLSDIVEGYMSEEYSQYFAEHPFLRISRPDEPMSTLEDDDDGPPRWR